MLVMPSAALRRDYDAISDLAHETAEPIYITNNGEGDVVVMSIEAFECSQELFKLKARLAAAETLRLAGYEGISIEESRAECHKVYT